MTNTTRGTNHEAPQCTFVYSLLPLPSSLTQTSSSVPYFETPSASGLPSMRLDQVPNPYKTVYVCIPSEAYFPCFGIASTCSRHVPRGTAIRRRLLILLISTAPVTGQTFTRHCFSPSLLSSRLFLRYKAAEA